MVSGRGKRNRIRAIFEFRSPDNVILYDDRFMDPNQPLFMAETVRSILRRLESMNGFLCYFVILRSRHLWFDINTICEPLRERMQRYVHFLALFATVLVMTFEALQM